jgi:Transmembrane Fragile-X-F protein.
LIRREKMADSSNSGGLGITGVLAVVFIVLKLVGVISWPWLWVLSPIWIGVLVFAFVLIGALIIAAIVER